MNFKIDFKLQTQLCMTLTPYNHNLILSQLDQKITLHCDSFIKYIKAQIQERLETRDNIKYIHAIIYVLRGVYTNSVINLCFINDFFFIKYFRLELF